MKLEKLNEELIQLNNRIDFLTELNNPKDIVLPGLIKQREKVLKKIEKKKNKHQNVLFISGDVIDSVITQPQEN